MPALKDSQTMTTEVRLSFKSVLTWLITTYHLTEGSPCFLLSLGISAFFPLLLILCLLSLFSIQPVSAGNRNVFCPQKLSCVFLMAFFFLHSNQQLRMEATAFLRLQNYIHLPNIAAQTSFASCIQAAHH